MNCIHFNYFIRLPGLQISFKIHSDILVSYDHVNSESMNMKERKRKKWNKSNKSLMPHFPG